MQTVITGRLIGIGVGPGDSELMTLKAVRCLTEVHVVAYVSAAGRPSTARRIAEPHLPKGLRELNLTLPMTRGPALAEAAYNEGASRISAELERGLDVAVLCEGDPLFYGSFAQLFARLGDRYPTEIVPGIASFTAAAAVAQCALTAKDQALVVLPATLPREQLIRRLLSADAAAILKLGRHLPKVYEVLRELDRLEQAIYVEYATAQQQRVVRLVDLDAQDEAPYFALVLLPGAAPA